MACYGIQLNTIWVTIINDKSDVAERRHLYDAAVITLRALLCTSLWLDHRGAWWTRLSTDLEHLKRIVPFYMT